MERHTEDEGAYVRPEEGEPMKYHRIGYVKSGHSEYDDGVWEILSKRHPSPRSFIEFDHLDLADCFVLAGADIKTRIKGGEVQVEIFIDPKGKSDFLERLGSLVEEKYAYLWDRRSLDRPSTVIRKRPHGIFHPVHERVGHKSKVVLGSEDEEKE